jgi:hypothetical protein
VSYYAITEILCEWVRCGVAKNTNTTKSAINREAYIVCGYRQRMACNDSKPGHIIPRVGYHTKGIPVECSVSQGC